MVLELKDLTGLGGAAKKLIEVVSKGIGAVYRPHAMRKEADARAYEIKTLAQAEAGAATTKELAKLGTQLSKIEAISQTDPALAERARMRLLARAIEGQQNIEAIADHAYP